MISPLVVTPSPFDYESLQGFILRTVQANGYDNNRNMLRYAGMSENEIRAAKLPLNKLVLLYDCDIDVMKNMEYTPQVGKRSAAKKLKVHGHNLPSYQLRLKSANFCPECVKHTGFISMFWDLKYTIACPEHNRKPLEICPSCQRNISWNRPEIFTCKCGYDLSKASKQEITNSIILGFQEVIWKKFHKEDLSSSRIQECNFPIKYLERMSLRTLFGLIERFYNIQHNRTRSVVDKRLHGAFELAAKVLSNWPNNFYSFLEKHGNKNVCESLKCAGLRGQFERFFVSIFKSGLPISEVKFIKEEFIRFGIGRWKTGLIDSSWEIQLKKDPPRIVGITKLADIIGVRPITVKKMIEQKILQPIVIEVKRRKRYLFDISEELPIQCSNRIQSTIGCREVGGLIGLPVHIISELREMGVIKRKALGKKLSSFHEDDVSDFKTKIENLINSIKAINTEYNYHISIEEVIRMKSNGVEFKADVIASAISGKLRIVGKYSNSLAGVVLNRKATLAFINQIKIEKLKSYSAVEAARILSFGYESIHWLAKHEYLDTVSGLNYLRVTLDSVRKFSDQYISCASIAAKNNSTSQSIKAKCIKLGIELLYAKRGKGRSPQPFFRKPDLNKFNEME